MGTSPARLEKWWWRSGAWPAPTLRPQAPRGRSESGRTKSLGMGTVATILNAGVGLSFCLRRAGVRMAGVEERAREKRLNMEILARSCGGNPGGLGSAAFLGQGPVPSQKARRAARASRAARICGAFCWQLGSRCRGLLCLMVCRMCRMFCAVCCHDRRRAPVVRVHVRLLALGSGLPEPGCERGLAPRTGSPGHRARRRP